jgi:hypothetical protein
MTGGPVLIIGAHLDYFRIGDHEVTESGAFLAI